MTREIKDCGSIPERRDRLYTAPQPAPPKRSLNAVPILLSAALLAWPAWAQQPPDLGHPLSNSPIPPVIAQIPAKVWPGEDGTAATFKAQGELVQAQTTAINFLNKKIDALEKRVAALEKKK